MATGQGVPSERWKQRVKLLKELLYEDALGEQAD